MPTVPVARPMPICVSGCAVSCGATSKRWCAIRKRRSLPDDRSDGYGTLIDLADGLGDSAGAIAMRESV